MKVLWQKGTTIRTVEICSDLLGDWMVTLHCSESGELRPLHPQHWCDYADARQVAVAYGQQCYSEGFRRIGCEELQLDFDLGQLN